MAVEPRDERPVQTQNDDPTRTNGALPDGHEASGTFGLAHLLACLVGGGAVALVLVLTDWLG